MSSYKPPAGYETRPVVVLGGGVLGRRIAACWAAGGWPVRIRDPSAEQRKAATDYIDQSIGIYTALTRRKAGSWEAVEDLATAVKDSWLVFEAVPEVLNIKLSTFADLEKYAPNDCILASNSSSYKSSELVERISDETKKRVLNTHYMMPPEALIVELMTDGHTTPEIFPFMAEQLKIAGLHPITALRESTGFVFNRIWAAIKRETIKVLAEGVSTPEEIDRVFKEQYSAREGPCHMMDNVGLDTVEHIEEHYIKERHLDRWHLDWLHQNYIVPGKLGNKSNKGGFYDPPAPGSQTILYVLNLGVAETFEKGQTASQTMHRGQILRLNASQGGKPTEILGHDYMPDGIDIHHASKRLFWTTMGSPKENDGAVYSAKLDGSDIKTVVASGDVHTAKQCVIDQQAGKLYFCDREGLRVMRVNLDGSGLETIVQTGDWRKDGIADQLKWCVGIAVSQKLQKFFWTQKGYSKSGAGTIHAASLDMPKGATASNRGDIETIMSDLPEPIDLEVDDEKGVLYWTDRGELPMGNTLNRKHLVGQAPEEEKRLGRQILAQGFGEAIGLRYDKESDAVFVADIAGRIWKCNAQEPARKEKVFEGATSAFTGLVITRE